MIALRKVTKIYPTRPSYKALNNIDMDIKKGDFVAIFGKSGSGKTTLLNIVGTLTRPTSGEVFVNGKNLISLNERELAKFRNREIGFIFQTFHILPDRTAIENVALPLRLADQNFRKAEIINKAMEALNSVGLKERAYDFPKALSGGQIQRIAIARALVTNPPLLLADEPTGNLDSETSKEIIGTFKKLHEERKITLLVATHDELIAKNADKVVEIDAGEIKDSSL